MSNNKYTENFSHQYSEDNITWFNCTKSDSEGYAELGYIIRPLPPVDVVENKEERVDDKTLFELCDEAIYSLREDGKGDSILTAYNDGLNKAIDVIEPIINNWQQSNSIEGIVGFVLEAAKYAYDYHANSQFPEMSFEDNCKNNLLQWMQDKSDIIKEYNKWA